jgi:hypothetical protein
VPHVTASCCRALAGFADYLLFAQRVKQLYYAEEQREAEEEEPEVDSDLEVDW